MSNINDIVLNSVWANVWDILNTNVEKNVKDVVWTNVWGKVETMIRFNVFYNVKFTNPTQTRLEETYNLLETLYD
jgi:hypothetical protein